MDSNAQTWLPGTGEMARAVRRHDWSATPLGPLGAWPLSLRTATLMVLESPLPMLLAWGRDLIMLYNDAYAPFVRAKPHAIGRPFLEVWSESGDILARQIARVLAGESIRFKDAPFLITRRTAPEEAFFDYSFSPVRDKNGVIAGVLNTAVETTGRVIAERALRQREMRCRALLTAGTFSIFQTSADWRFMHVLHGGPVVSTSGPTAHWIEKYIPEEDRERVLAAIERAIATKSLLELEHRVRLADGSIGWGLSRAVPLLDGNGEILEWFGAGSEITEQRLAAEQLREKEGRQAFLLQLTDTLRTVADADAKASEAARLLAEHLDVDRAILAEVDEDRLTVTVRTEHLRSGSPSLLGRHKLDEFGPFILRELHQGHTVAVADVERVPGLTEGERGAHAGVSTAAFLIIPLIRNERLAAYLAVTHPTPREWSEGDKEIARQAADRTWVDMERARAEAALCESEERLRQFGEASQDILWTRDASTLQWQYLTPAFEEIYGLSRDEAAAGDNFRSWLEMVVPADREAVAGSILLAAQGEKLTSEFRIRRPSDGKIRWLRETDFPIHDEAGRVVRIGGVAHDVTELKRAEEAATAAEQRQRALLDGIPQLVWRANKGEWTWASRQWTEFTGQSEVESRGWGWLEPLHPDDRDTARSAWSTAVETGGFEVNYRIRHKPSGEYRWFATRATPVRSSVGRIVEWLGTSTDVHDLQAMQERQAVLVAELQHRTRNLIAVVRSMADKTMRSVSGLPDFRDKFRDRLEALARVQSLLSRLEDQDRVTFDELIAAELSALGVQDGPAERVVLDGPTGVRLRSSTVQTLALALHELATNALKYGALRQPTGHLAILWGLETRPESDQPWLHIVWQERGVRIPNASSAGHGRDLIERALPYQLEAETSYELGPDGVHCTISMPVSRASWSDNHVPA